MKKQLSLFVRVICVYLVFNVLLSQLLPISLYGTSLGPTSPDFANFTPVGSNNMVNPATGAFNYNIPLFEIPGPHGGGYAMSISYDSGVSPENEASWVGLGWTLSPGSITRNLRGFPDEFNGQPIKYYNKTRPVWTVTKRNTLGLEFLSKDLSKIPLPTIKVKEGEKEAELLGGLSLAFVDRINNYTGYQLVTTAGVNFLGYSGLNINFDQDGVTYNPYVSPSVLLSSYIAKKMKVEGNGADSKLSSIKNMLANNISGKAIGISNLTYGYGFNFNFTPEAPKPHVFSEYSGFSYQVAMDVTAKGWTYVPGVEVGESSSLTFRQNVYQTNKMAYGYLNSSTASSENVVKDFYLEKDIPYNKYDTFLGVPFSNYDSYVVTGPGVSGGFRSYLGGIGYYTPNKTSSNMISLNGGLSATVGPAFGVGMNIMPGYQLHEVDGWDAQTPFDNNYLYRFSNDLGGELSYSTSTSLEAPKFKVITDLIENNTVVDIDQTESITREGGNSSVIVKEKGNNGASNGFSVVDKQGVEYQYYKPVRVKNETNISVSVNPKLHGYNDFLVFRDLPLVSQGGGYSINEINNPLYRTIVGSISPAAYPINYLLTSVLQANYADLTNNGPSDDDTGGWTKFDYRQCYGGNNWYRYRTPYKGLHYERNMISDVKDDLGSVVTGEKEVYYLNYVETKTHIAVFVTNKSDYSNRYLQNVKDKRKDGIGASDLRSDGDPDANNSRSSYREENDDLEYLQKIVLFPKNQISSTDIERKIAGQIPIKTVHFEYDYSLVPNVSNNINSGFNYGNSNNALLQDNGRLTLRKIWFEYGDVNSVKISPYVFNYHYPSNDLASRFTNYSDIAQNPTYEPGATGPWGTLSPNGKERAKLGIPFDDQSAYVENEKAKEKFFDPAAYHLKSIQLPSGGSIYIEYESNDYAFVQDRSAMAMARVVANKSSGKNEVYSINPADLGVDPDGGDLGALASKINTYFNSEKSSGKVYFKFLFGLNNSLPDINNPRSEYITGYAEFKGASVSGKTIDIGLGTISSTEEGERSLSPRGACQEFILNHRLGKIEAGNCVEPQLERVYDDLFMVIGKGLNGVGQSNPAANKAFFKGEVEKNAAEMLKSLMFGFERYNVPEKESLGKVINPSLSFIKLPVLHRKYGGGVRVKKIVLYDDGGTTDAPVILGKRYRYQLEDGITSSGVATNEPQSVREENPLVDFMIRKGQEWPDRLIAGVSKEQSEGLLGETALPAASIVYSNVIVEDLHAGKTGNGFVQHEFYTTRDFPFDKYYDQELGDQKFDFNGKANAKTVLEDERFILDIPMAIVNFSTNLLWAKQGFRFIQNNMNGKPKKVSTYAGAFESFDLSNKSLTGYTEYEYYKPGEKIRQYTMNGGSVVEEYNMPGKEMEVIRHARRIRDEVYNLDVEFDIIVSPPPAFEFTGWPTFSYSENQIATLNTTKVISYPAIEKRVTTMNDGVVVSRENIVFDKLSGNPLVVKSSSIFDDGDVRKKSATDALYTVNIPAAWKYGGMGSGGSNQLDAVYGSYLVAGEEPTPAWFSSPSSLVSANIQDFKLASYTNSKIGEDFNNQASGKGYLAASEYSYKGQVNSSSSIKERGKFNLSHSVLQNGDDFLKLNEVTQFSPHGEVLEQQDVLGNKSAVLYGSQYNNCVPVMVANNSDYSSLYFNDFENILQLNPISVSHTGTGACLLSNLNDRVKIRVGDLLKKDGGILKFWGTAIGGSKAELNVQLGTGEAIYKAKQVATVGAWTLYEVKLRSALFANFAKGDEVTFIIHTSELDETSVVVDDIRFQLSSAQGNCYVYDDNLRLVAEFDDQHFGSIYQYNRKGLLVRKLKETKRGLKTIEEVNYNTYKENRN